VYFFSNDSGHTFSSVSNSLPSDSWINALLAAGNTLFAGTSFKGIYRLSSTGVWTLLNNGISASENITCLTTNGSSIFAGTWSGVYISNNNGDSWTSVQNNLPSKYITSLIYGVGKIFVAIEGSLYSSTDNGASWQKIEIGINFYERINSIFINGSSFFIGTEYEGVISSLDNGTTWARSNSGLANENIQSMVKKNESIFLGTKYGRIYESMDHGNTWSLINDQLAPNPLTTLILKGDSLLASTNGSGVLVSVSNGLSWTSLGNNLFQVYDMILYRNKILAGTPNGVYEYESGSDSWVALGAGIAFETILKLFTKDNIIFAGTSQNIYYSKDDGKSWSHSLKGTNGSAPTIVSSGKFIVTRLDGVTYTSENTGDTWQSYADSNYTINFLSSIAIDSSYVFFGGYDGLHFSTSHGKNLAQGSNGLPSIAILSLLQDGDTLLAGTTEGVWSIPISSFSPTIASFTPTFGSPGTLVTISGANFDVNTGYDKVRINNIETKIVSATSDQLIVQVPEDATTGPISIEVGNHKVISLDNFCVGPLKPIIVASGLNTSNPILTSSSTLGNQWFLNGNPISGATNKILNLVTVGIYTVQVTIDSYGCPSSFSDPFNSIITEVSTHLLSNELIIYPNPTNSKVFISLKDFAQNQNLKITIFNATGENVYQEDFMENNKEIDMTSFSNGIYVIKIQTLNSQFIGKFVKN
jgi:photosystem II stability/assembly factor-like uncharacterized protein